MGIEYILLFILITIIALISTIGWMEADNRNDKLHAENKALKASVEVCREDCDKLKAKSNFYKYCTEDKEICIRI